MDSLKLCCVPNMCRELLWLMAQFISHVIILYIQVLPRSDSMKRHERAASISAISTV